MPGTIAASTTGVTGGASGPGRTTADRIVASGGQAAILEREGVSDRTDLAPVGGRVQSRARSRGGNIGLFDLELDPHLAQFPDDRDDLPHLRVEVILEHGWSRVRQVQVGVSLELGAGDDLEVLARRHVLDDAGRVRDAHVTE